MTYQEPMSSPPRGETIDLTTDDSPVKPKKAPPPMTKRLSSPPRQLGLDDTLVDPPHFAASTSFCTPRSAPTAGSTVKSARCVTFAPDVEQRRSSPSPTPLARASFATSEVPAKHVMGSKHQDKPQIGTGLCITLASNAH